MRPAAAAIPSIVPVEVHDRILAGNDRTARHNREHFAERACSRST